jgi:hypothetical protein
MDIAYPVHQLLTVIAGALAAGVTAMAVLPATGRPRWLPVDWFILAIAGTVAVTALVGLILWAATGGPEDGLHSLYAALALLTLPVARILGSDAAVSEAAPRGEVRVVSRRLGRWLLAGGLITVGALVRLWMTG